MAAPGTAPPAAPSTSAAPAVSAKQAQAAAIALSLQTRGHQLEVLAERLNRAKIQVDDVVSRVADAQARVDGADAQVQAATATVRRQAVDAYVRGGQNTYVAFSDASGFDDLARRAAYVASVVRGEQDSLRRLRDLRRQLDGARAGLADEQHAAEAALGQVLTASRAAASMAAAEGALLSQARGELAALVQVEQARLASQDSAAVQSRFQSAPAPIAPTPTTRSAPAPAPSPSPLRPAPPSPAPPSPVTQPRPSPPRPPALTTAPRPGQPSPAPPSAPPSAPPAAPPGAAGPPAPGWQIAVAAAQAQLGKPYLWGGAGPDSFDCSGLTMWSWAKAGVALPHLAQLQYALTRRIPIASLQPGDLVFYGTPANVYHVGIYVGGGTMIDAPATGQFVHYTTIYFTGLLGGGRVN